MPHVSSSREIFFFKFALSIKQIINNNILYLFFYKFDAPHRIPMSQLTSISRAHQHIYLIFQLIANQKNSRILFSLPKKNSRIILHKLEKFSDHLTCWNIACSIVYHINYEIACVEQTNKVHNTKHAMISIVDVDTWHSKNNKFLFRLGSILRTMLNYWR